MAIRIGIACFPTVRTDAERMSLSAFRYHPDPLATGGAIRFGTRRACRGKSGGGRNDT